MRSKALKKVKIIDSKGNIRVENMVKNKHFIQLKPGERVTYDDPKTIKIHFEISADEWNRASRYITNFRMRHEYAKQAFIELINRKEGRDKKLQAEKMVRDSGYIQDMIDKGLIKLSEVRS